MPKTLTWYESAFQALTRTVPVSDADQLTKSLLQDFVVRLRERGLSPVSCNTYAKALNAFFDPEIRVSPTTSHLRRFDGRVVGRRRLAAAFHVGRTAARR